MKTPMLPLLVLLLLVTTALPGCRSGAPVSDEAAATAKADNAVLIDVRSDAEWAAGHLPEALHIPVGTLAQSKNLPADKATPIVTYCAAGVRAGTAVDELKALGYTHVSNGGGMAALAAQMKVEIVKPE